MTAVNTADAEPVLPLPAWHSISTAAHLLSNPLTTVILTGDELDVRPGEWLLQTAAGSTVGQSVIQRGPASIRCRGHPRVGGQR